MIDELRGVWVREAALWGGGVCGGGGSVEGEEGSLRLIQLQAKLINDPQPSGDFTMSDSSLSVLPDACGMGQDSWKDGGSVCVSVTNDLCSFGVVDVSVGLV